MLDVRDPKIGEDMVFADEATWKARNVLTTQVQSKTYLPNTFGVDLDYFLTSEFDISINSFQSYAVKRLIAHQINVTKVGVVLQDLLQQLAFQVGDQQKAEGFISQ